MAKTYPDGFGKGMFLPTDPIFDVHDLKDAGVDNENLQELLLQLHARMSEINSVINFKTTGIYAEDEFVNGNRFYKPASTASTGTRSKLSSQTFIKKVTIGTLPAGGTASKSVAHGISFSGSNFTFTRVLITATDPTTPLQITIPYINVSGTVATNIEAYADGTNIVITKGTAATDLSGFTNVEAILEYIKY